MNPELKIIIKAVTDSAKKAIKDVKGEVEQLGTKGAKSSKSFGQAIASMAKVTGIALTAVVGAIGAVGGALIGLGKSTQQFRTEQAKLITAFESVGSSAKQAGETYNNMFRFLGDSGKAVEASAHLAKITQNQKDLAQWTKISQGIYATFGDSLPIEGLTEASNETLRVGQVTGVLADALNWAGENEDAFNAKLAQTTSYEEREKLLRETLNGLYEDASNIYEKNNSALLAYNESQAKLETAMASAGNAVQPLMTAVNNLGASFFNALTPALNAIMPYINSFISKIAEAVNWVLKFFNIMSGSKSATTAVANSVNNVATGASTLANNTDEATKSAEKLKRSTAGFDELNVVSSNSSGGSGSSGGATSATPIGGGIVDTSALDSTLNESDSKISSFVDKIKSKLAELKSAFEPTVTAWKSAFNSINFGSISETFNTGLNNIRGAFESLSSYVLTNFIPSVTNSFSVNLAPVVGDVFNYILTEGSKCFSFWSGIANNAVNTMVIPALNLIKKVANDVFDGIGKAWNKHGQPFIDNAQKALQGVRDTIQKVYDEVIKPVWDKLVSALTELWDNHLKPLWDNLTEAFLEISTNITIIYNEVLKPLIDWLVDKLAPIVKGVINEIIEKTKIILASITDVVNGIITVIRGIINFLTGVFTGDWKKAWEGVKQIFKGIFDSLVGVIKAPLNLVISSINVMIKGIVSGVNTAIKAINKLKITVPDWVPNIGGKTFGFNIKELTAPTIPQLAKGGIVVSETLARIGEGGKKEAVLPLEQNTAWMSTLADKIAERSQAPTRVALYINERELGYASISAINNITRETGSLKLALY